MKLTDATEGKEYIVNSINTKDEELNAFFVFSWMLQWRTNHSDFTQTWRNGGVH